MPKLNFHYFPRDFEAGNYIENFLVSAVTSLLIIRLFLAVFDYPQLGGSNFHIAHMLWGGLLMVIASILQFVFLNRETKYVATIVSGVGFGAFIDELGKFLTNDNDYFYKPTVALIYVVFVVIFLTARIFERFFKPTEQEYAINALEVAKQIIMHDLDTEEKQRALYLLKRSNNNLPIVMMLQSAIHEIRAISIGKPTLFHQIREILKTNYLKLIHNKLFIKFILGFFIVASILNFANSVFNFNTAQTFAEWGELIFSFISGLIVILGAQLLIMKRSRKLAYEMFKYAVLISIFLTQFFRFLHSQFSAISVLVLSLIVFNILQYLIYEESLLSKSERKSVRLEQA